MFLIGSIILAAFFILATVLIIDLCQGIKEMDQKLKNESVKRKERPTWDKI